jgi:hypothetical protein
MSYSSHRCYIGPANVLPRLRCERLEDRSLLSVGGLFVLQDLPEVFMEELPPDAGCDESIMLEEGIGEVVPVDEEIAWEEVEFTLDDPDSWDDTWYYEEDFIDENWVPEEEYFEDTWYSDEEFLDEEYYEEEYIDETWYEEEFIDESWIPEEEYWDESWIPEEEYYDDWLIEDDGEFVILPTPGDETGEWQERDWTQWNPLPGSIGDESTDELIYYTMVSTGGIPVLDSPGALEITEIADPPLVTPVAAEEFVSADPAIALPPSTPANNKQQLPEITTPRNDEDFVGAPSATDLVYETANDSSSPGLATPGESEDHLADPESLELSEEISMD